MTAASTIPFYDRSEEERIALTAAAIDAKKTVIERWTALDSAEASPWSERAKKAAAWLQDEAGVADLGCGTMTLERYLRPEQIYIPLDVVRRDHRTLVCDFNEEEPPITSPRAVACLGLIEYLLDPPGFMRALSTQYDVAVISYCVSDAPDTPALRRAHAWVNDYDTAEMEAVFRQSNWTIADRTPVDGIQLLWRLRANDMPGSGRNDETP